MGLPESPDRTTQDENFGLDPKRAAELRARAQALVTRVIKGDPEAERTLGQLDTLERLDRPGQE